MHFMGIELGRLIELYEVMDLHLFKITSWDYKEGIYLTWFSIKKKKKKQPQNIYLVQLNQQNINGYLQREKLLLMSI